MNRLTEEAKDGVYLAGGSAHPSLTHGIAEEMGVVEGNVEHKTHPNSELYVRLADNVRGRHVVIVQPHIAHNGASVNDVIMEQSLMVDAARSSSASQITAVCPYFGYSRQDRKSKGREPIGVRVVMDLLASAGVERIVTVDLHASQSQGIFRGPFDNLTGQPLLRKSIRSELEQYDKDSWLVVAPDAGAGKLAVRHSDSLGAGLLYLSKTRDPANSQTIRRDKNIPEADGHACVLFDDMLDTAGTLVSAAESLKNSGATAVFLAATHGIFSDPAITRLQQAPIERVFVTDTHPMEDAKAELGDTLQVVSVAPTIGRALIEIITDGSVSEIFEQQNFL